jgi:hypothetical protein
VVSGHRHRGPGRLVAKQGDPLTDVAPEVARCEAPFDGPAVAGRVLNSEVGLDSSGSSRSRALSRIAGVSSAGSAKIRLLVAHGPAGVRRVRPVRLGRPARCLCPGDRPSRVGCPGTAPTTSVHEDSVRDRAACGRRVVVGCAAQR